MRAFTPLLLAALFAPSVLLPLPARADEEGDQIQKLLASQSPAVATVKIVVKTSFSGGGQSQDTESRQEIQGVVVTTDGLIMLSNSTFSSDRMKDLMGGLAGAGGGFDMKMTPTDFKVIFEKEDKEYKAFLAATDAVLGLAFIKVEDLGDRKLTPIDFTGTVTPVMGQKLVAISRLSKGYDYAPYYNSARLSGVIAKPRNAYLLDGSVSGLGLPVYTLTGEPVGVLTVLSVGGIKEDMEGAGGFSMLMRLFGGGGSGSSPVHTFLIPNANVNTIITQAKQRAVEVAVERAKKKAAAPTPAPTKPAAPVKPKAK